jgi:NADH:ubiquinone oxidoreductase subunit 5 (subunit L)/multisubunit Na+/H+ antiporter MnhA subunit
LNGFASEFLIYLAAFHGEVGFAPARAVPCLLVIGALGLSGGLAALCFTKVVGIVFLGEPRTGRVASAHRSGWLMIAPQLVLAAGCLLVGLTAPVIVVVLAPIAAEVAGMGPSLPPAALEAVTEPLFSITSVAIALFAVAMVLALVRRVVLAGRTVGRSLTWDCGYARPTARMQYTGSSYVQPATTFFAPFLRTERRTAAPAGLFPRETAFGTETPDFCKEALYRPTFGAISRTARRLRWLQHGHTHIYIMYIALTLVALLVWYLGVVGPAP